MKFQEAKNLRLGDIVFTIGNDSKVYSKQVTGISFRSKDEIDITCISQTEKNISNGYISSHKAVYIKEKHALKEVLEGWLLRSADIEAKTDDIRIRIKKLENAEDRR
jgi:hypothetical protein